MSASSLASISLAAASPNGAVLKLVGSPTCSTFGFSPGGRTACGSGLHRVTSSGSKFPQTSGAS